MLFSSVVQPPTISLFSSTSSDPLNLFSSSVDPALPSDSFIHFLQDRLSSPVPGPPKILLKLPNIAHKQEETDFSNDIGSLEQTVLHIQSPTIQTTYIQSPPFISLSSGLNERVVSGLGIKHPRMHLQVRNLGREWSFEAGIVDQAGRIGVVRFCTFQKAPRLKLSQKTGHPPILLLPLSFPAHSTLPLTPWSTVDVHFPSLLSHFSSLNSRSQQNQNEEKQAIMGPSRPRPKSFSMSLVPSGTYSHVLYVRVYANCRIRRIWFSDSVPNQKTPWEFNLYSAHSIV